MPIFKVSDVVERSFDYVIVGGGTAGLAVAARLSEDPSIEVLVIEAGLAHFGDPKIDIPHRGATLGDPQYDWAFPTVKQPSANNQEHIWSRGKGLGGTSNINFLIWMKAPISDIDAIEKLGNPGWNWQEYNKYFLKSESFHPPAKAQTTLYPHTFDSEMHGIAGPVQTTIPPSFHTIDKITQEAFMKVGLRQIGDPGNGDITGAWISNSSINPETWKRSNAANAYLLPNINRPNLGILTECLVSRIIFKNNPDVTEINASAVEFISRDETYTVEVKREVVLSAGAINSPKILELSGIGNPKILSNIGVDVKLNLPGVGENTQDHSFVGVSYEFKEDTTHETFDLLADADYLGEATKSHALGQGILRNGLTSFAFPSLSQANPQDASELLQRFEEEVNVLKQKKLFPPALAEQFDIQMATLKDDTASDLEIVIFPALFGSTDKPEKGKKYVSLLAVECHPFSRGYIHAISNDPKIYPEINSNILQNDIDLEIHVQHVKFARKLAETEPLKADIACEVSPGPNCISDAEIREYIRKTILPAWHTIGSCSMLPREKDGVVDPKLKVYGTSNVRVADLSVIPLHIASHTQSTAYVIGEKAADLIKAEFLK